MRNANAKKGIRRNTEMRAGDAADLLWWWVWGLIHVGLSHWRLLLILGDLNLTWWMDVRTQIVSIWRWWRWTLI